MITDIRRQLLEAWSFKDPVSDEECERYRAIKKVQKNENAILSKLGV